MLEEQRKKRPYHFRLSQEEIHAIRTMPGHKAGRPKGSVGTKYVRKISKEEASVINRMNALCQSGPKKNGVSPGEERVVFKMLKSTRETLNKCAAQEGVTALALLHAIAQTLRSDARYAHLFTAPAEAAHAEPQTR